MGDSINLIYVGVGLLGGALSGLLVFWAKMAKYQQKVDDLKSAEQVISAKIDHLRTDVDIIKAFRVNAQKFIDKQLYQTSSPLSLALLGEELVNDSGFAAIFLNEKDELAKTLETLNPQTRYDVQEKARGLMDNQQSYAAFEPIKTYAFNNGKDFEQILRAGSILLRDYYLDLHPEITR